MWQGEHAFFAPFSLANMYGGSFEVEITRFKVEYFAAAHAAGVEEGDDQSMLYVLGKRNHPNDFVHGDDFGFGLGGTRSYEGIGSDGIFKMLEQQLQRADELALGTVGVLEDVLRAVFVDLVDGELFRWCWVQVAEQLANHTGVGVDGVLSVAACVEHVKVRFKVAADVGVDAFGQGSRNGLFGDNF